MAATVATVSAPFPPCRLDSVEATASDGIQTLTSISISNSCASKLLSLSTVGDKIWGHVMTFGLCLKGVLVVPPSKKQAVANSLVINSPTSDMPVGGGSVAKLGRRN